MISKAELILLIRDFETSCDRNSFSGCLDPDEKESIRSAHMALKNDHIATLWKEINKSPEVQTPLKEQIMYTAYAIVGMKIHPDKLYVKNKVKTFAHDFPKNYDFCPFSKRDLWKTERTPIFNDANEINGLKVIFGTDKEKEAYLCIYVLEAGEASSNRVLFELNMETEKQACKIGAGELWDENAFGLYCVLQFK